MQIFLKPFKVASIIFTTLLIVATSSCNKDDSQPKTELINPDYKNLQLNSGFINNGITINAKNWSVEYVKDAISGEMLLDKDGKPVVLNALGSVELQSGWLKLEKKHGDDLLNLSLKENFSPTPRKFLIGIFADGKRDELSFTQTRGETYSIVKKEIAEVSGSRREYTVYIGDSGPSVSLEGGPAVSVILGQ